MTGGRTTIQVRGTSTHCALLIICAAISLAQSPSPRKTTKPVKKEPFTTSSYYWSWYTNGLTEFSFSLKNQSGSDVTKVSYRVLFFDSHGNQIHFEEPEPNLGTIPNGMARMMTITLDMDSGDAVRHQSSYEKIEILGFENAQPETDAQK